MKHKYIEMIDEINTNDYLDAPNMIRMHIDTDEEAELIYSENKDKFTILNANVVDGEHFADASKNKPCIKRTFDELGKLSVSDTK